MPELESAPPSSRSVGPMLQYWRKARRMSQLGLANEAEVSPRHVCFVETGRAKPSREMVVRLATVLDVPLRERNALLLAAGFAPLYPEAGLDARELAPVRRALDAMLAQQEPYPAVVMSRRWDILKTNGAADRLFAFLLAGRALGDAPNVLRAVFHPDALRPHIENWDVVAESLVQRAQRESLGGVVDPATAALVAEVLAYPGVPAHVGRRGAPTPMLPVVPVVFARDGQRFAFFSTVTTLGSPQDVTVQELRIECFFPTDEETAARARALAGSS
ncbi:MAG TPA: helix-turn-helix transcriptional regulator [Byssovorax sp.]